MTFDRYHNADSPRWLHGLAVLTVLCALPLLLLGAGVTSHGVGMIDPRGFRPPWEIVSGLFENSGFAWRLEYGHRTFGFLVGLCGIALALGCWFCDRRAWVGWLGFAALALICVQGALGILRVDRHAEYPQAFKLIHGCFAQIVFAVLVALAVVTSRRWQAADWRSSSRALKRWSILTCGIVYFQLVLGGVVRHTDELIGPRGHLLGAFVVFGAILWLMKQVREDPAREKFSALKIALKVLLTMQLLLGVESWLARFHVPQVDLPQLSPVPMHAEWVRSLHYLFGTLLFAAMTATALLAHRASPADEVASEEAPGRPARRERVMEGVS